MQAIIETLFDAVYLVSVVTIGILMIRGNKGNRQFCLFGWMAVVLGSTRYRLVYHWSGELHSSSGYWKVDYFGHNDHFLCVALLCLAAAI